MSYQQCPNCGSFLFKLLVDNEDNVYAFCLDCMNEKRTDRPQFLMTGFFEIPQHVHQIVTSNDQADSPMSAKEDQE